MNLEDSNLEVEKILYYPTGNQFYDSEVTLLSLVYCTVIFNKILEDKIFR